MKNKSNDINSKQSNLIVDFYEYEHGNIKCFCYTPTCTATDYYAEIIVSEDEFEQYLKAEGYLKDASEDCVGADHEGNPIWHKSSWDYSMQDILTNGEEHPYNTSNLLTTYIKTKKTA
jgi:hypothetical protein